MAIIIISRPDPKETMLADARIDHAILGTVKSEFGARTIFGVDNHVLSYFGLLSQRFNILQTALIRLLVLNGNLCFYYWAQMRTTGFSPGGSKSAHLKIIFSENLPWNLLHL